jgi:hypothetical protein
VVALDGKALRRSHDRFRNKGPIHMVSAWARDNGLVLGRVKVDEKSDEISAIPELLLALELSGCMVTIDANQKARYREQTKNCRLGSLLPLNSAQSLDATACRA